MNFYDNVHEMVKKLKETEEYTNYVSMKEKIKQDTNIYAKIKEFKEKQRQQQLRYIEGTKPTEAEQQYMQNLYSIIIQNAVVVKERKRFFDEKCTYTRPGNGLMLEITADIYGAMVIEIFFRRAYTDTDPI